MGILETASIFEEILQLQHGGGHVSTEVTFTCAGTVAIEEFFTPLPPDLDRMSTQIGAFSDAVRELARLTTLAGNFPFQLLLIQPYIRCEVVSNSIPCMAAKRCADELLDAGVLRRLQDMRAAGSLWLMRSSRHWRILHRLLRETKNQ